MFLKIINSFYATGLFLYFLRTSGTSGYLMFSGDIEKDQWHEMGYNILSVEVT